MSNCEGCDHGVSPNAVAYQTVRGRTIQHTDDPATCVIAAQDASHVEHSGDVQYMPGEARVLELLGEAAGVFSREPRQHPSEGQEFAKAIHDAQHIVMARFAQRHEGSGITPMKDPS